MRRLWILIGFLLPLGAALAVELPYGKLVGIVFDPEGNPVPNAKVTFTSRALLTGPKVVYTNKEGSFSSGYLPAGKYEWQVQQPGLKTITYKKTKVHAGETLTFYPVMDSPEIIEYICFPAAFKIDSRKTTQGFTMDRFFLHKIP